MNTLKYKGYIGSVAYSEPDKVFFGKIEGIDGLVNYEGESVAELTAAFHEAVEDYLIFCEEHNCKPEKSYTGTFNVRISPATHRDIANRASEAGINISDLDFFETGDIFDILAEHGNDGEKYDRIMTQEEMDKF